MLKSFAGEDGYAEGVLLHGMGGLGKSSLAARLCDRLPDYRRLVWVGQVDELALLRVLGEKLDDAAAIARLNEPGLSLKGTVAAFVAGNAGDGSGAVRVRRLRAQPGSERGG